MEARYASIDELCDAISVRRNEQNAVWLLGGAGCSSPSVPLANELVKWASIRYPELISPELRFADVMSVCPSREKLIADHVANARLTDHHLAVAGLVERELLHTILTTNYDTLYESALRIALLPYKVIDLASSIVQVPPASWSRRGFENAVIYLHGVSYGFRTVASDDEISDETRKQEWLLAESANKMLIICGYSGLNDNILSILMRTERSGPLFWFLYEDEEPHEMLKEFIGAGDNRFLIRGYNAETSLQAIGERFICQIPDATLYTRVKYRQAALSLFGDRSSNCQAIRESLQVTQEVENQRYQNGLDDFDRESSLAQVCRGQLEAERWMHEAVSALKQRDDSRIRSALKEQWNLGARKIICEEELAMQSCQLWNESREYLEFVTGFDEITGEGALHSWYPNWPVTDGDLTLALRARYLSDIRIRESRLTVEGLKQLLDVVDLRCLILPISEITPDILEILSQISVDVINVRCKDLNSRYLVEISRFKAKNFDTYLTGLSTSDQSAIDALGSTIRLVSSPW